MSQGNTSAWVKAVQGQCGLHSVHLFGLSLFLVSVSAVTYRLPTTPAHLKPHCLKLQIFVLHQRHQAACVLVQTGIRVTLACSVQKDSSYEGTNYFAQEQFLSAHQKQIHCTVQASAVAILPCPV